MARLYLFFLLLITLTSCKTRKLIIKNTANETGYCYPAMRYKFDIADISSFLSDRVLVDNYTKHDILLSNYIGMLPALKHLAHLQKDRSLTDEKKIILLEEREKIIDRLLLASIVVSSISAELDCEGERASQLASFMEDDENKRITKLTALSIVLGAAAGVLTNVLNQGNTYYSIGVGGGVASGLLALATLSKNKKVQFYHNRNMLSELWYANDSSTIFPSFVWYIFNDKEFSNDKAYSMSHNIKERWEKFGRLGKEGSKNRKKQIDLIFGKGGKYNADQLQMRSDMLDQLQSYIRLLNQDLESLIIAVSR